MGKIILKSKPFFKSPLSAFVIKPIRVGPPVQPISPANAKNPNITVDVLFVICVVRLMVPGHIAATENPHNAHPTSERTGDFESPAKRYEKMQRAEVAIRYF